MSITNKMNVEEEYLSGTIERITYHNADNGFCILRLNVKNKRDLVTLVGSLPSVFAGEFIQSKGKWINNKEHGLQFKASFIKATTPNTLEGIEKYLSSGLIRGIGAHYAKKLVICFKEDVFEVIEQSPEKLVEVPGIGKIRAERISKSWFEQKIVREIMIFLQSHGVGTTRATRIYKTYGDDAIKIVTDNPYRLAKDITGIGFLTADSIARKLGIEANSIIRAEAGISFTLLEASGEGHCGLPRDKLITSAIKLLEIDSLIIEEGLSRVLVNGEVTSSTIEEEEVIFLSSYYRYEQIIADKLKKLKYKPLPWDKINLETAIPWVEKKLSISLATSQREALSKALSTKLLVITGGPGTGKTTLVKSILTILKAKNIIINLGAPTGRAAKRLSESCGLEAKTIHRLLEFSPGGIGFKHNQDNPLEADLVVVDEASMIDVALMSSLLKAIPESCVLIIVGDVDQLPSVGPGNVLGDIIKSNYIPVVILTEIYRQAADSLIITNAHRINKGLFPLLPQTNTDKNTDNSSSINNNDNKKLNDFYFIKAEKGEDIFKKTLSMIIDRIPKKFHFDAVKDIQVLCPMQHGGSGAGSFNIEIQKVLNPPTEASIEKYGLVFSVKDKVMQIENDYDKEVYNGDIGFIQSINKIDQEMVISFDNREIKYDFSDLDKIILAYAITIHKSQGSECPVVIIPVLMQNYMMLKRNLIYTAVTRGKNLVIIIGEKKALTLALHAKRITKRYSKLKEWLK